jgi:predicted transcriptional regulator
MVSTPRMVSTTTNTEDTRHIVATELDSELFARLNAFADKNDRSRSWVIRQALLQFLGRKSRK